MAADFDELREHIMRSLDRIESRQEKHGQAIAAVDKRLSIVETKALLYGTAAAIFVTPIIAAIMVEILK